MRNATYTLLFAIFCLAPGCAWCQKVFDEGVVVYRLSFSSQDPSDKKVYDGTYTLTVKGKVVRKELTISNGYNDVVIMNGNANSMYSLQVAGDKKYAIQHNLEEHLAKQKKYEGFAIKYLDDKKTLGGYEAQKVQITYSDGESVSLYCTKALQPAYEHLYDRLPGATFLPLEFDITNERNIVMHFTVEKIELKPVESSYFRIPADYKMISYAEYKELNK